MDLTTIRTLPVKLTDEEINTYAREVSQKCLRVQELEAEKADHAKSIKGLIDGLTSEMRSISFKVQRREEARDVECHWVYLWTSNVKELIRMDTGEVVETRPIESHEKQQRLALEREAQAPGGNGEQQPQPATCEKCGSRFEHYGIEKDGVGFLWCRACNGPYVPSEGDAVTFEAEPSSEVEKQELPPENDVPPEMTPAAQERLRKHRAGKGAQAEA